jgi:carbon-monoxide dehydrogenase large subunit
MGGSAVLDAAAKLLVRFREAAAERLGVDPSAISVSDGRARTADGRSVPLSEVAHMGIASEGQFDNWKPTYTYGAAAVHVAVDAETGHVQVVDYTVCDDVGRIINHLTLHGQVMGAVIQGFGSVFSEEIAYDENGTMLVGTLADYLMPLSTDYPHVHCVSMESYPSPNNPLGAKGAGEGGLIPVGGAVANAIASALRDFGVQPNHLPLSPNRLWDLIQAGRPNVAAE